MRNKKLGALTLFLLVVLLGVHMLAMEGHWYIRYSLIDLPLHFLGGVCLALSTLYILKRPKLILISTFILGICWEIFEIKYDLTGWKYGTMNYNIDTTVDLIMDMLGGFLVWGIYKYKKIKDERISNIS